MFAIFSNIWRIVKTHKGCYACWRGNFDSTKINPRESSLFPGKEDFIVEKTSDEHFY